MIASIRNSIMLATAFVGALLGSSAAVANPDTTQPFALFAVHGRGVARFDDAAARVKFEDEYRARANKESEIRERIVKLELVHKSGGLAKLKPVELSSVYIEIEHLRVIAQQLEEFGETAGVDLRQRSQAFHARLNPLVEAYRGANSTVLSQRYPEFQKLAKSQENNAKAAEQLLKGGKPLEAEVKVNQILDNLNTMAIFYTRERWTAVMTPFQQLSGLVVSAASNSRLTESERLLAEARDAESPALESIKQAIAAAVAEVAKSGKAKIADKTLTGPELVLHFTEEWKRGQLICARMRGLELSRGEVLGRQRTGKSYDLARLQLIDAKVTDLTKHMTAGIAKIIDADAARIAEAEVAALHAEYLEALAPVAALQVDEGFATVLEQSLAKLVAKSSWLAANEKAYTEVVSATLMWRKRIADEVQMQRKKSYPFAATKLVAGMLPKPPFMGMISSSERSTSASRLQSTAFESIANLDLGIKGTRVQIDRLITIPDKKIQAAAYSPRYTAVADLHKAPVAMVDALRQDVYAPRDSKLSPLNLTAAKAIYTAENGYWASCGAEVDLTQLKSLVTTMATAKEPMWVLTLLGPLPPESIDERSRPLTWMIVQMKIRVEWARHEYFIFEVEPTPVSAKPVGVLSR